MVIAQCSMLNAHECSNISRRLFLASDVPKGKNIFQVIDRKYIDAKVIEAHIVPGKLLLTRRNFNFLYFTCNLVTFVFLKPVTYGWTLRNFFVYDSIAGVGETGVWLRADFQSGSRVLKKVF